MAYTSVVFNATTGLAERSGSHEANVAGLPATATVAADVATLVADGATPTQAHVNTLNTDWGTFLTAENSARALLVASYSADVLVSYNTSLTINQLRSALRTILARIEGTF